MDRNAVSHTLACQSGHGLGTQVYDTKAAKKVLMFVLFFFFFGGGEGGRFDKHTHHFRRTWVYGYSLYQ